MNWYSLNKIAADSGDIWKDISRAGPDWESYLSVGDRDRVRPGDGYSRRRIFTGRYSWAVPSPAALERLKRWLGGSKVIEVAAGRGLWARLLRDIGVTVEASDLHPPEKNEFVNKRKDLFNEGVTFDDTHTWTEVVQRDGAEHAKEGSGSDALMMVWPYMDEEWKELDWQKDALGGFGGDKFILVGEWEGGATGSTGLWRTLNKYWREDGIIDIPRWEGMHDRIFLFRRK